MNPSLVKLAQIMQQLASAYLPKAYLLGKAKAARKYGTKPVWSPKDAANVELLLTRHADELSRTMATLEQHFNEGVSVNELIESLKARAGSWAWVLSPALSDGLAAYVDENRSEIARQENIPSDQIGIIWYNARDAKVCDKCLYLSGRWFDAKEAYQIASTVHPNCRCPAHFDVGTPDEAMVGPIPDYKPGTVQDVFRDLNVAGLSKARINRARRANWWGKPSQSGPPPINL